MSRLTGRGRPGRVLALTAVIGLVLAACGSDSHKSADTSPTGPRPTPGVTQTTAANGKFPQVYDTSRTGKLKAVRVKVTEVAHLDSPIKLVARPGSDQLYVAEQAGLVRVITMATTGDRLGTVSPTPVLDVRSITKSGGEQGLLGLAFSADGKVLYVSRSDLGGNSVVESYAVQGDLADPSTRKVLLQVKQPYPNHNGGNIVMGPDHMLWFGLGDGGSEDDPDNTSQNPDLLLGKMLRIDPAHPGHATVWAKGLRNPWRFSFDRSTHDLWIGDVGQDTTEEIDERPAGTAAGSNFGWSGYEGTNVYRKDRVPKVSVPPVFEVAHSQGWCAITGGVVYRGPNIPSLVGAYLFGDYCKPGLYGLRLAKGVVTDESALNQDVKQVISIDEDGQGNVFLVSLNGAVYRLDPG